MQSFVTGQLYVNLDFYPGSAASIADIETLYPQIGTMQTGLEKLGKTIETLPLDQLAAKTVSVLEGLEKTINSPTIPKILDSLQETADNTKAITAKVNASLESLVGQLGDAAKATAAAMNQARETIALRQGPAAALIARLDRVADAADQTLATAKGTLGEAQAMLSDRSTTRQNLEDMLTEFSQAARAIRSLADYLDRHPEALLQGRR
jgi:paraquat-inducible protein B